IRNDTDETTNLFALAADFRLLDVTASAEWPLFTTHSVTLLADYVKNVGYKAADVFARSGATGPPRNKGYDVELAFGSRDLNEAGRWRTSFAYRYLERDAVLDAFTDSDFHLGGTDAKGYIVSVDVALARRVWARLRYLSANEIDNAPLGIDVWQLDL